jgi:hypothetical protein
MDEDEEPNTMVARLMPTLSNKLHPDRLGPKELATVSHGAGEQVSVKGSNPFTVSLIRALSLQVTTRSAARQAIDHQTVGTYNKACCFDSGSAPQRANEASNNKFSEAQALF